MKKNLAAKLRTGAVAGLVALAVMVPSKAKSVTTTNLVYDSGLQAVTNAVSGGDYVIEYRQTVKELITNGGSTNDCYLGELYVKNKTLAPAIPLIDKTFLALQINADLVERGATGLTNFWATWHYETVGTDRGEYIVNSDGAPMMPTQYGNYYYTIRKDINGDGIDDEIGWENVNASMTANRGAVNFGYQVPVSKLIIPFPQKIYLSAETKKVTWHRQTNNLGANFIVYKSTNLLNSVWGTNNLTGWEPVQTNTHSSTATKYEYLIPTNEFKAFFGVIEAD